MIHWANQMFYDEKITKKNSISQMMLRNTITKRHLYCVVLSTNPNNLLDIIRTKEFKLPCYRDTQFYVLGLASGYDQAVSLVLQIVDEVYQATGDVNVREYYKDRWRIC